MSHHRESSLTAAGLRPLPSLIFSSRWLQLPLYLGLIVAQGVYVFLFLKELWHLVLHATEFSEQQIMLVVLGLIDVVMISNLLMMVIVGGYETFVSRLNLQGHPDQPEWLGHVNAGILKVKLAMAIIGISSIHLLRTFIEAGYIRDTEEQLHGDGRDPADGDPFRLHPLGHWHRLCGQNDERHAREGPLIGRRLRSGRSSAPDVAKRQRGRPSSTWCSALPIDCARYRPPDTSRRAPLT
jgi:uncharacterized protein (TIGR00645 family)